MGAWAAWDIRTQHRREGHRMTQVTQTSIPTLAIAKAFGDRLGNEFLVAPYMRCYTESTLHDNSWSVVNLAGIPTPNAASTDADNGAGNLNGTGYAYYVTFYDQTRDREGNGVQGASFNAASRKRLITFNDTNSAANSTVTHRRVYRNLSPSGAIYYLVATVAVGTGTYDDNSSDATISANDTYQTDNDAPATSTYGIAKAHKGRMFLAGPYNGIGGTAYDHDFTWSKLNKPHAFPTVNRTKVEPGRYGILRALEPSGDALIFYKDRAIFELRFNTNSSGITGDGFGKTVNTERGALNQRCVVNVQGTHYVMDQRGIYAFSGGTTVVELAARLGKYWPRINWGQRDKFTGVAGNDRVYFFVALDQDTECRYAFVFDLTAQYAGRGSRWFVEKYSQGIRDACRINMGVTGAATYWGLANTTWPVVLTEYGYIGILGIGFRDFVDPLLTASGTATGGTTTTLVDSGATFTRTNEASLTSTVVGAYIRFNPSAASRATTTGAYAGLPNLASQGVPAYRITGVSGTTITFTPAVPTAIGAGDTYVIGGIPDAVYHTPLLHGGAPQIRKVFGKATMEFQPGGHNYTIGFGVKKDRRGPEDIGVTTTDDPWAGTVGAVTQTVDMGGELENDARVGFVDLPTGGRACNYMQMFLDASGIDKPAIVDSLEVSVESVRG